MSARVLKFSRPMAAKARGCVLAEGLDQTPPKFFEGWGPGGREAFLQKSSLPPEKKEKE